MYPCRDFAFFRSKTSRVGCFPGMFSAFLKPAHNPVISRGIWPKCDALHSNDSKRNSLSKSGAFDAQHINPTDMTFCVLCSRAHAGTSVKDISS